MNREYPELGQLIGAWFHEDYDGESIAEAVAEYAQAGPETVAKALAQADDAIGRDFDEERLHDLFVRHGCSTKPSSVATYSEFLTELRGALDAEAQRARP